MLSDSKLLEEEILERGTVATLCLIPMWDNYLFFKIENGMYTSFRMPFDRLSGDAFKDLEMITKFWGLEGKVKINNLSMIHKPLNLSPMVDSSYHFLIIDLTNLGKEEDFPFLKQTTKIHYQSVIKMKATNLYFDFISEEYLIGRRTGS